MLLSHPVLRKHSYEILKITNDDVFRDVVEDLIFGGKPVVLGVKANVDVETETGTPSRFR